MPTYECDYCNYSTIIKTQYNRHLNTQKHTNNMNKHFGDKSSSDNILIDQLVQCNYCSFKYLNPRIISRFFFENISYQLTFMFSKINNSFIFLI